MRISTEEEVLPTVSLVDSTAEPYATWSSTSERGPRTRASTPPFMRNYKSQVHDPLSVQVYSSSEIESDVETQSTYSNHKRPRPSILLSQLQDQHTVYSQEVNSNTMDKKGQRAILEEYCLLQTLEGHNDYVNAVIFSPDDKLLASASSDSSVQSWDARSGTLLQTFGEQYATYTAMAFSPDGRLLAVVSGCVVELWDARSGALLQTLSENVEAVAFSPDGKLLTCDLGCDTKLWDARSGELLQTILLQTIEEHRLEHLIDFWAVAFSPDGKLLAGVSKYSGKLWDARSGTLLQTFREQYNDQLSTALAVSLDGKLLASVSPRNVKLWDVRSGALLQTLYHRDVMAVAFSPNGRLLASASIDKAVRLWNAHSGALLQTLENHNPVSAVAFSSDGKLLASASVDMTVELWTVRLWEARLGGAIVDA
jgi:WD40 repeat protein